MALHTSSTNEIDFPEKLYDNNTQPEVQDYPELKQIKLKVQTTYGVSEEITLYVHKCLEKDNHLEITSQEQADSIFKAPEYVSSTDEKIYFINDGIQVDLNKD